MEMVSSSPTRRATTMWWRPNFQGGGMAGPFSTGMGLLPELGERLGEASPLGGLAAPLGGGRDLGPGNLLALGDTQVAVELPWSLDCAFDEILGHSLLPGDGSM